MTQNFEQLALTSIHDHLGASLEKAGFKRATAKRTKNARWLRDGVAGEERVQIRFSRYCTDPHDSQRFQIEAVGRSEVNSTWIDVAPLSAQVDAFINVLAILRDVSVDLIAQEVLAPIGLLPEYRARRRPSETVRRSDNLARAQSVARYAHQRRWDSADDLGRYLDRIATALLLWFDNPFAENAGLLHALWHPPH